MMLGQAMTAMFGFASHEQMVNTVIWFVGTQILKKHLEHLNRK
jgi:hypothetical protein